LIGALERGVRAASLRRGDPELDAGCLRVARWQSLRLATTYADLAANPRYRAAVAFFQSDLYGGAGHGQRDADLARVVPLMVRLLPGAVVLTVARAMELAALSEELDAGLARRLGTRPLNGRAYAAAYRDSAGSAERERQIELLLEVGQALDRYVRKPLLRASLAAMRRPAHAAGLGDLQGFLERGFEAFARMNGAGEFLAIIEARERALMRGLFDGDPKVVESLDDDAAPDQD